MKHRFEIHLFTFLTLLHIANILVAQNLTIRIDPQQTDAVVSEQITVEVKIENAVNLGTFQFDLVYNTDVVHADNAQMGSFLGSTGRTVLPVGPDIDNASATGKLTFGGASFGTNAGPNGSGVLATVVFTSQASGNTALELQNVLLGDISGQEQTVNSVTGGQINVASAAAEWEVQQSGTDHGLLFCDAVSDLVAWAVGSDGTILRTTNGGKTWADVWPGPDTTQFQCVDAFDAGTAFVTGWVGDYNQGENAGFIYRTTNTGNSWIKVYEQAHAWINHVKMFNQSHGVALGDPVDGIWKIMKTSDGGDTWEQFPNAPADEAGSWSDAYSVFWLDNSNGWFGTNNSSYFYTNNGGSTWGKGTVTLIDQINSLAFNQDGVGMAAYYQGKLIRTLNGSTWEALASPDEGLIRYLTSYQNDYWLLQDSTIYSSHDDGTTWNEQINAHEVLRHLSLVKEGHRLHGWAVGHNGIILKYTTDIPTTVENLADETGDLPSEFALLQNYPNPFNPETTIEYQLARSANVELSIYDLTGNEVWRLDYGRQSAGRHAVRWNGRNAYDVRVSSGIYIYRIEMKGMEAGHKSFVATKKMILMK